jgi:hypothetical protein
VRVEGRDVLLRRLAHHEVVRRRDRSQARGDVDRVTAQVVEAVPRVVQLGEDETRMHSGVQTQDVGQAGAHLVTESPYEPMQLECARHRALRVVLVSTRYSEEGDDLVSHELVHDAVVLSHDATRLALDAVHHLGHFFRIADFVEARVAAEVGHPDRHLPAFALRERRQRRRRGSAASRANLRVGRLIRIAAVHAPHDHTGKNDITLGRGSSSRRRAISPPRALA